MLQRVIEQFSREELQSLLPKGAIDFIRNSICEEGDQPLDKNELAKIVYSILGANFINDNSLRKRLIDAMPKDLVSEILNIEEKHIKPEHYNRLQLLGDDNPVALGEILGISFNELVSEDISSDLTAIKRIQPTYALYPYQRKMVVDALAELNKSPTRFLLHLPTGAGKTRTAMNIVSSYLRQSEKKIVLWLADREELCIQAFREFQRAWEALGNREITSYGYFSESQESLSGLDSGFLVVSLQKILSLRNSQSTLLRNSYKQLQKHVGLIVFDEAHKAIAPQYKSVINDFLSNEPEKPSLIGLTATPGRNDRCQTVDPSNLQLVEFFAGNKISLQTPGYSSPIQYLVQNRFLAKANFISIDYHESNVFGYQIKDLSENETNKELSSNRFRNKNIINIVKDEVAKGSKIIVFACTVEHSIFLSLALNYCGIPTASIETKTGTKKSRREKIKKYRSGELRVLTNYGVLVAGFDDPSTNVAIIAKPTASLIEYLQMAGRAMRGSKSEGNLECRIYTVRDDLPHFKSISLATAFWNNLWENEE